MNSAESPATHTDPHASTMALADLDTATLIATIVARYHRVHSQELPELIQMAERVETVHHDHAAVPTGLASLLKQMLGELTTHMQKEELILFPHMSNAHGGDGSGLVFQHPIAKMMAEHEEHGACLERIRKLANDFRVPDDGCGTWRALYAGVAKFADDLVAHVDAENTILFPRFLADS